MARILFPTGKVDIGKSAIAVATPVRDAEPSFTGQATEDTRRAKKREIESEITNEAWEAI